MPSEDLARARKLLEAGQPRQVIALLAAPVAADPIPTDAAYVLAVAQRYAGAIDAAQLTLRRLLTAAPEHPRALQELGHLHREAGAVGPALEAYERALLINPALRSCYEGQLALLDPARDRQRCQALKRRLAWLDTLPKPLHAVIEWRSQGRLAKAEALCRSFLQRQQRHVEAMRLLADLAVRLGALDEAAFLLDSALTFDPDHRGCALDYVQVLRRQQRFDAALQRAERLCERYPEEPQLIALAAIERLQTGRYAEALAGFAQVLTLVPEDPATLTNMGHVLKTTGETAAAIAHYQRAIAAQPGHGEAWYALSNLKTYRFEAAERSAMDAALAAAAPGSTQRVHLHFALGKALEDAEQFDDAFHHYCSGNALKKAASRYDAQQMSEELAQTRRLCTSAVFAGGKAGCSARDPIFIVGLPRAGSTLLEQILASHSEVDGTLELPNLLTIAAQLRRGKHGYPEALSALDAQALTALGERYLAETRIHRQGASRFIDKMPNNFRHIGLIRKILPNARVIDARRDPIACCVSGFRQLFAEGQEFTYDLTDLGRYYRDYLALMAHWQDTLPGFVLQVDHEQVIDDLEGQVRRLLAFCDLPFEVACLRYYETRRSVRTPSSEQVRQPIYRDGIEYWRRFEAHLGPLRQALNAERPEP